MPESVACSRLREKMRITRITDKMPKGLKLQWGIALSELPPNARLVAMAMRLFGDTDGRGIRPSIDAISLTTGLSRSTVKRAITVLMDAGFLIGERSGGKAPSQFELVIPGEPVHSDPVDRGQPVQTEDPTGSKSMPQPVHGEPESCNKDLEKPCKGAKAIGALLPAGARASTPAQPTAPAASQARGLQMEAPQRQATDRPSGLQQRGPKVQSSPSALQQAAPKPQARDPWSEQSKQQARALLQCDLGRRAAREGWAITLYDFAREHGRLPVDGEECARVRAAGLDFARKIEGDRSPLGKAARKRAAELITAIVSNV